MKAKIITITFLIIMAFSVNVIAKYNYTYTLNAYNLIRDNSKITYTITKNISDEEYTNKDVLLTITLNKPVENVSGFELSENRKTLTKLLIENESQTITVEDDFGNIQNIDYSVSNIDKEPPQIIGVEDGKTYNTDVKIKYTDNVGIKDIFVEKYSAELVLSLHDDYYDTSFFRGTDLTDTTAKIRVIEHPKNTRTYKYYINNELKAQTENTEYKFTGLSKASSYTIKVEAIDEDGNVLDTKTRGIKTRLYSKLEGIKNSSGTFSYTVYGIDSSIDKVEAISYTNDNNKSFQFPSINSNRNVTVTVSAQDITGTLQNGYYYFHLLLYDNEKGGVVDTACFNVKFNENISESSDENSILDVNNLTSNGNYQIIVTDFAENKTKKLITINKGL